MDLFFPWKCVLRIIFFSCRRASESFFYFPQALPQINNALSLNQTKIRAVWCDHGSPTVCRSPPPPTANIADLPTLLLPWIIHYYRIFLRVHFFLMQHIITYDRLTYPKGVHSFRYFLHSMRTPNLFMHIFILSKKTPENRSKVNVPSIQTI